MTGCVKWALVAEHFAWNLLTCTLLCTAIYTCHNDKDALDLHLWFNDIDQYENQWPACGSIFTCRVTSPELGIRSLPMHLSRPSPLLLKAYYLSSYS